jgi:hypothetical protein
MSNNVILIDKRRGNQTPLESSHAYSTDSALPASLSVSYADIYNAPPLRPANKVLSLQQLYPELSEDSRMLRALNLIERARKTLQGALIFDPSTSFFVFDQEIMRSRALLVKAFEYRDIGEGYAALINALIWALGNRKPNSPSRRQTSVMSAALDRLTNGPYMQFDTAMQVMDELEDADLDIEPPTLDILTAELDD